jgi:alkylation response protein AidB-like acyl-CoA dehydrogenase
MKNRMWVAWRIETCFKFGAWMDAFRDEVRGWLEANCPVAMRQPVPDGYDGVWGGRKSPPLEPDERLWLDRMSARGWTAPTWPREYGGGGLDAAQATVLREELRRLGCRPALKSLGLWMLGPVLLKYGTEEQKRAHLPAIARGETRWCQGYSEPEAGSDLASLRTRAVLDGEGYVVDGRKIWTSHAHLADWMFCLVRTDPEAPKHRGITFLLVDMSSPGIGVRPITLISGASPFCETTFEGVRVPAANVVGRAGEGWEVAKAVLEHERALISSMRDERSAAGEPVEDVARAYGALQDPVLRDRIAQLDVDLLASRLTVARAGQGGPVTSMLKLYGTEVSKRRYELLVSAMGYRGLGWSGEPFTAPELDRTRSWLRSRASSIEGGSSEIQLNIIAKRVLGLPDGA